jgi:hypothetical protein
MKVVLGYTMAYTNASMKYSDSFRDWSGSLTLGSKDQLKVALFKRECRIFKTFRPFHFKIGDMFYITETTFSTIMSDIVLQNVVALLLL